MDIPSVFGSEGLPQNCLACPGGELLETLGQDAKGARNPKVEIEPGRGYFFLRTPRAAAPSPKISNAIDEGSGTTVQLPGEPSMNDS